MSNKGGSSTEYIKRKECEAKIRPVKADISIIKKALVGDDLRGGLVKDTFDMKKDVETVKKDVNEVKIAINHNNNKSKEFTRTWKLGITLAIISALALLGSEVIKLAAGLL